MDALDVIVTRAREGETEAFGILVRRFQDMAVGYGYSILHDFQLAEDAAQEAFFEAYTLSKLREPAAFAGWFRRIVFKAVRPHHPASCRRHGSTRLECRRCPASLGAVARGAKAAAG